MDSAQNIWGAQNIWRAQGAWAWSQAIGSADLRACMAGVWIADRRTVGSNAWLGKPRVQQYLLGQEENKKKMWVMCRARRVIHPDLFVAHVELGGPPVPERNLLWFFFHYTTTSLIFQNQKITFWQLKRYSQKGNNPRKRENDIADF